MANFQDVSKILKKGKTKGNEASQEKKIRTKRDGGHNTLLALFKDGSTRKELGKKRSRIRKFVTYNVKILRVYIYIYFFQKDYGFF